jgi:hypothetical protein
LSRIELFVVAGGIDGKFESKDRHAGALQARETDSRLRSERRRLVVGMVMEGEVWNSEGNRERVLSNAHAEGLGHAHSVCSHFAKCEAVVVCAMQSAMNFLRRRC